jgi:CubicO group peptidase (beta-lactamase class C family)
MNFKSKTMKNLLLFAFFLLGIEFTLFSQSTTPDFIKDSLDSYIDHALKEWNIPGVAVAIVKDGQVVLAKGYGKQSMARDEKVDENTLFMIGSNTKAFTGTVMAMLQYGNACSLNDKVVKWLPDFTMKDPWVTKELNLTDILCHRIGMETFQGDFMYWTSDLTKEGVIEKFGKLEPEYDFRTKWGYTNAGFLIAGQCIQKISSESWESNVKNKILIPLEMNRTLVTSTDLPLQKNIAAPHTLVFDTLKLVPYPAIDNLAPAGSISSSVNDMSHWLLCLLDNGLYKGKEVIPSPAIQETRKPRSIIGGSFSIFNHTHFRLYGLGWELMDYEGREVVSHTGGVNGFVTSVTLFPGEKLGIVILTNTDQNYFYEALKLEIMDAYLNLPYRNYSQLYRNYIKSGSEKELSAYRSQRDTISMHLRPAADLSNFTGHYLHPVYGFMDISKSGNRLKMTLEHHPNLTGNLECLGGNRFLCTYSDPIFGIKVIRFITDGTQVKSMKLRVADFVEGTEYVFDKK